MSTLTSDEILILTNEELQNRYKSLSKSELLKALLQSRKQSTCKPTRTGICDCENNDKNFDRIIALLDTKFDSLIVRLNSAVQEQAQLRSKIELIEKNLFNLRDEESKRKSEAFTELEQRMLRRNNLAVSGIPETSTGTVQERDSEDKEFVSNMLQTIGVNSECIMSIRRVGKSTPHKPRLLLLSCSTFAQKHEVLKVAKNLRKFNRYKGIYINPDQTKMQRSESFALREELRRRREAGEDVVITKGKIVEKSGKSDFS